MKISGSSKFWKSIVHPYEIKRRRIEIENEERVQDASLKKEEMPLPYPFEVTKDRSIRLKKESEKSKIIAKINNPIA